MTTTIEFDFGKFFRDMAWHSQIREGNFLKMVRGNEVKMAHKHDDCMEFMNYDKKLKVWKCSCGVKCK
jgi:hypothetical protein